MRYEWESPESFIREVEVRPIAKWMEGLVYFSEQADTKTLRLLEERLRAADLTVTEDKVGDRYALRVGQIGHPEQLLTVLTQSGAAIGKMQSHETEYDHKPATSFVEKIKGNINKSAGYAYVLGDALMMAAGLVRMRGLSGEQRKGGLSELATGSLWFAPNVLLATCGKTDPDVQMGVLMRRVQDYLDKQGVEIPAEDQLTLDHLVRKDGLVARLVEFFYAHPTEINNSIEATGAVVMVHGGYHQKIGIKEEPNPFKMAAGVVMGSGMGGSVLMKEPPKDKKSEQEPKGALAKWFSKPMHVASSGAIMNNFLNIIGASAWEGPRVKKFLSEYEPEKTRLQGVLDATDSANWKAKAKAAETLSELEKKKIIAENYGLGAKCNLATACAFLMANGLYSMGTKDTSVDLKALGAIDQLYAVIAHVIAAQPKEHQPELLNRMAGFLSSQPDVHESADEVAAMLRGKAHALEKAPWTQRVEASPQATTQLGA